MPVVSKKHKILLVEDEENLAELLKMNLELEGFEVLHTSNGARAVQLAGEQEFSLVVLDIMIPGLDGFEVCQRIRKSGNLTPIIFLSAKNTGDDRVNGLKLGGDDYLSKPFNLEELLLRVKLLISKNTRQPVETEKAEVLNFNEFTVNFNTYEVFKEGKKVQELTKREILLLKLLAEKQHAVVSREEILDKIWGEDAFPSTRTIDNYILAFRKYFNDNPKNPRFFHSIRGVGYKFTP